ncbi:MAG TPA: hypothetical protein VK062_07715, partial [Burkholderiaceae bacterium]|nr:hypothetical protein [Burkholderiaceae bacterium]
SGIEQVNDAVSNMDQVTRQNATLVQEAEAATSSLESQAEHLARLVDTFKIQATASRAPRVAMSRSLPDTGANTATRAVTQAEQPASARNALPRPEAAAQATYSKPATARPAAGQPATKPQAAAQAKAEQQASAGQPANKRAGTALRTTASGVTVGAYQTSAGAVEEWEEF